MRTAILSALLLVSMCATALAQSVGTPPYTGPYDFASTGALKAGQYYGPFALSTPTNIAIASANKMYAEPFFVPATSTLKTLTFDIGTGNASAWNARMCVYQDNGKFAPDGMPLLADSGTVAVGSGSITGTQTSPTLNSGSGVALAGPSWYWVTFNADATGASVFMNFTASGVRLFGDNVVAGIYNGVINSGVSASQTFGACPATFPTSAINRNAGTPYIELGF